MQFKVLKGGSPGKTRLSQSINVKAGLVSWREIQGQEIMEAIQEDAIVHREQMNQDKKWKQDAQ